jgi:hypothetical protein
LEPEIALAKKVTEKRQRKALRTQKQKGTQQQQQPGMVGTGDSSMEGTVEKQKEMLKDLEVQRTQRKLVIRGVYLFNGVDVMDVMRIVSFEEGTSQSGKEVKRIRGSEDREENQGD